MKFIKYSNYVNSLVSDEIVYIKAKYIQGSWVNNNNELLYIGLLFCKQSDLYPNNCYIIEQCGPKFKLIYNITKKEVL